MLLIYLLLLLGNEQGWESVHLPLVPAAWLSQASYLPALSADQRPLTRETWCLTPRSLWLDAQRSKGSNSFSQQGHVKLWTSWTALLGHMPLPWPSRLAGAEGARDWPDLCHCHYLLRGHWGSALQNHINLGRSSSSKEQGKETTIIIWAFFPHTNKRHFLSEADTKHCFLKNVYRALSPGCFHNPGILHSSQRLVWKIPQSKDQFIFLFGERLIKCGLWH